MRVPSRWGSLAVVSGAQLLIVLDACSVSIALPSAQTDLGISDLNRLWITNSTTLAWGSLLLLGGRIADYVGRKQTLLIGLLGFAAASLAAGSATSSRELIVGRAFQGAFAGILTPAALAILTVTFVAPRERARAFGVYGGVAAAGSAAGLLIGGLLTQYFSWRWCLFVDAPIALAVAMSGWLLLSESKVGGKKFYDLPGAITATSGLAVLAYGITTAGHQAAGDQSRTTWPLMLTAVVLLTAFWVIESRSAHPLLPPAILLNRHRGGALLAIFVICLGVLPIFLLTLFLQRVLGYTPMGTGAALLPLSLGIAVSSGVASEIMPLIGAQRLALGGLASLAAGLTLLTRLSVHSTYVGQILPAQTLISLGLGFALVPLSSTALLGVERGDAGVGSAAFLTTQQVGGALGVALLNTVAAVATAKWLVPLGTRASPAQRVSAAAHGYTTAFGLGAILTVAAGAITLFMLRPGTTPISTAVAQESLGG